MSVKYFVDINSLIKFSPNTDQPSRIELSVHWISKNMVHVRRNRQHAFDYQVISSFPLILSTAIVPNTSMPIKKPAPTREAG